MSHLIQNRTIIKNDVSTTLSRIIRIKNCNNNIRNNLNNKKLLSILVSYHEEHYLNYIIFSYSFHLLRKIF